MPDNSMTPLPGVPYLTYEDATILMNFEQLWLENVFWLRSFFRSALTNRPDLATVTNIVFQTIPLDFYNEFSKYFGPEDSQKFLNIFSRLTITNWQLINAYKSNDQTAIDANTVQWYQISEELSDFLASVNKFWDADQLKSMFREYIQFKIQEIIAFLNEDYELETKIFDEIENKATRIGTYMAMGIIERHAQVRMQPTFLAEQMAFRSVCDNNMNSTYYELG